MYVDMRNSDNYTPINPWLLDPIAATGRFENLIFVGADDETD